MKRLLFGLAMLLGGLSAAHAAPFIYPQPVDTPDVSDCEIPEPWVAPASDQYPDVVEPKPIDINGDGICELQVNAQVVRTWSDELWQWDGNSWQKILDTNMALGLWFGAEINGMPQIFELVNLGHNTNPEYATSVHAWNAKQQRYHIVHEGKTTHGVYMNEGLKAYKAGDYETALANYLNAYRMYPETGHMYSHVNKGWRLNDASNIAITLHKLGRNAEAAQYVLDNLEYAEGNSKYLKSAYFNLTMIYESLGNSEQHEVYRGKYEAMVTEANN